MAARDRLYLQIIPRQKKLRKRQIKRERTCTFLFFSSSRSDLLTVLIPRSAPPSLPLSFNIPLSWQCLERNMAKALWICLMEIRQSFISELDKVSPFLPPGWQLSPQGAHFTPRACDGGSDSDSLGSHLSLSPQTVPLEMSAGAERSRVEALTLTSWRVLPTGPVYAEPLLFLRIVSSQARQRARCSHRGCSYRGDLCEFCATSVSCKKYDCFRTGFANTPHQTHTMHRSNVWGW